MFAFESAIVDVILNEEAKGEHFIFGTEDGDFLFKIEDLKSMGVRDPLGSTVEVDGEQHIYLKSIEGVAFEYDEKTLLLKISVPPYLLSKMVISLQPERRLKVFYPKENSMFVNYRVNFSGGESSGQRAFNLTDKAGVRLGDVNFITDTLFTSTKTGDRFLRLQSNVTYEQREGLRHFVLGDQFAYSGDLGSSLNMGGIGFMKVYGMDPYFLKQPMLNLSGLVAMPSDAEIYLDGVLIGKEKLSPGEFELKNI